MKTKVEFLEILRTEKPELARRYGLKRLAPLVAMRARISAKTAR
jgi:hypothetical protein